MAIAGERVHFTATIEKTPDIDGAYIRFPFDVQELYGVKGQVKIKALFDGTIGYRGSLAKMGSGCHLLGITKDIRSKLNKTFGDEVVVEVTRDSEERTVDVPDDVSERLEQAPKAKAFYEKMSYTNRKEYIRWIGSAKKAETRSARIESFLERMDKGMKFGEK